jgi:hypothetical protein
LVFFPFFLARSYFALKVCIRYRKFRLAISNKGKALNLLRGLGFFAVNADGVFVFCAKDYFPFGVGGNDDFSGSVGGKGLAEICRANFRFWFRLVFVFAEILDCSHFADTKKSPQQMRTFGKGVCFARN